MSDNIRKAAGHLRAWPSAYRMGEHDTNVCIVAANGLDALEAKDQRIAELDAVVNDIASQAKTDELWDIGTTLEDADIEGAYDIMIQLARSVASEDTRKEASSD